MTKYCTECGAENLDEANFCFECGLPFDEYDHSPLDANAPLEIPKKYNEYNIKETSHCFNCRQNSFVRLKKESLLSSNMVYFCTNCGLTLEKSGNSFRIMDILDRNNHMWQLYKSRKFKIEEWKYIANGGLSQKDQMKQDEKIESLRDELSQLEHKRDIENISLALSNGEINLTAVDSPINLEDNEEAILSLKNIRLSEPIMSKNAKFENSFKLAKGVALKAGSGKATNAPHNKLNVIEIGTFVVTNRRLIFSGSIWNVSIDLIKILSINVFNDGISIVMENEKNVKYFTGTDEHSLTFNIDGKERTLDLEGNILRALILGQMSNVR